MRIKVWISTDIVNSRVEHEIDIDDEEWAIMTQEERDDFCRDYIFEYMDWGYEPLDDHE